MARTMAEAFGESHSWRYEAVLSGGAIERGVIGGGTEQEAKAALRAKGLLPLTLRPMGAQRQFQRSLRVSDLSVGLRILADLCDTGMPVNRVLATFETLAPPVWVSAIPALQKSIREGMSFAGALESAPIKIPPLVIGIIAAGEAGAGLPGAVRRAAELMDATATTRAAVRAALTYPLILAVAGTASIGLLVGVVLPRFAEILADLGQVLPPATQALIRISLFTRSAFVPFALIALAGGLVWYAWANTAAGRLQWHAFLLAIPGVASQRNASASSRAAISLSALLESGVPLPVAMLHAARATGDAEIGRRLGEAREALIRGDSLAQAVTSSNALTETTIRLIGAGEHTGQLPELMRHAGRIEQERADRTVKAAVRLLEPTLVLTFAAVVGLVAAALLQAVYSVKPNG